ncbi:transcriptional regulator with XRE-family HTH domain [Paenibacillus sp. DS2015]|uniref:helix-turn-helix transcriptional regulator n=1 Tax=Paenibacillus sp. DS2015 TaxID=3373917 RepID=UPI003D221961
MFTDSDKETALKKKFSARFREALEESKKTQEALANELKISKGTITNYLSEEKPQIPSVYIALEIAEILNVSIDFLFGLDEAGKEHTPYRILRKLYSSIADSNLQYVTNDGKTVLISRNNNVSLFLKLAFESRRTPKEIDDVAKVFKNYKLLNGDIVTREEYQYELKRSYVSGDLTVHEYEPEFATDWENIIRRREIHWEETTGSPTEDLHDVYNRFLEGNP